ncbi:venom carboxylesterase-6-like isoform X2 [Anoplophora glabripennis]|uniref:venom carboxylesterase-6-like isoform X2 n=1 Tax=Anoplophora glabripennis TaxID=217634 RepID=UPI000873DFDA|nr:venom carboxylesterase-6-like isoform X2 [Anoplophora glabripennis]
MQFFRRKSSSANMCLCKLISVNALLVLCNAIFAKEDPIVDTKYGVIKGKIICSRSGTPFYAFQGIPYAKPPVGNLRFKAPVEPSKWPDILTTQENAPHCLQKNYLFSNPRVIGSEECLYLNVYTPKLRARRQISGKPLLPVMVFIHWGGFFTGFSSSDYLGPEYIMDKNVILVTFNYRLGFFSTNDDAAPGNYGLKDQVAALKWVKNNIEYFGGNSERVTIFGQSAGGASVHFHMFSPESKNLFHRGISQSGTSLALWAKPLSETQLILAQTQATLMGCQELENTTVLVECLRTKNAEKLVESGDKFKFFSVDPLNVYLPSIEQKTENNPNPFITKQPIEYIRSQEFYKVPWIVGVVTDEGLVRAEAILRQSTTRKALNKHFNTLMPELIALSMSTPSSNVSRIWTKIKEFYFRGTKEINITDPYNVKALIDLYSDRSFSYSTYQAALFHNLKGHKDIWFYNFNYTGQYSYGDVFAATNENINYDWGVSHCDDLLYLFNSSALFPIVDNNNDKVMIKTMTDLWTNFAIYGHPTPINSLTTNWQKLNNIRYGTLEKEIYYMNINGSYKDTNPPTLNMRKGFYKERFKFWEEIPLAENIEELDQIHIEM